VRVAERTADRNGSDAPVLTEPVVRDFFHLGRQRDRVVEATMPAARRAAVSTACRAYPRDALESTLLPGRLHRDPADRILVALSRRLRAPLVTSDRALRAYRGATTIW